MMRIAWTPEEDAVLSVMIAEGCTFADMATELGASRSAVAGRVHRLQIKGPRSDARKALHFGRNAAGAR